MDTPPPLTMLQLHHYLMRQVPALEYVYKRTKQAYEACLQEGNTLNTQEVLQQQLNALKDVQYKYLKTKKDYDNIVIQINLHNELCAQLSAWGVKYCDDDDLNIFITAQ